MGRRFKLWFLFWAVTGIVAAIVNSRVVTSAGANLSESSGFDAASLYDSKCAKCHGKDGRAKSLHAKHVHARDLTTAEWQNDVSDERIFNSISNGKGKMPSFKKSLTENQIDSLVTFVRQLKK